MSAVTAIYVVILGFCAVASGFFSGSETALIGIGRERVHQLTGQGRRGDRVAALVADPDRLLSTLLVANNLVNILVAEGPNGPPMAEVMRVLVPKGVAFVKGQKSGNGEDFEGWTRIVKPRPEDMDDSGSKSRKTG